MQKKKYASPTAEFVLFAPTEAITTWSWKWGNWELYHNNEAVTPSVTGTQSIWIEPWNHENTSDPY